MRDNLLTALKIETMDLKYVPKTDLSMDEIDIGEKGKTLFEFAFGECHLFTAALNKEFGYRMRIIWNENRRGGRGGRGIVHAYASLKYKGEEYLYDAYGRTNISGIKQYIDDEIEEEELEPLFTSEYYDDYEVFLTEFIDEFKLTQEQIVEDQQTIKDVQWYLKQNMRIYIPQYEATIEQAKRYGWSYISEEVYDQNECQFIFENDELEIMKICLCKNQGYRLEVLCENTVIYKAFLSNLDELTMQLEHLMMNDYKN